MVKKLTDLAATAKKLGSKLTPAELRKDLPIPAVLEHYGHEPVSMAGIRYHYISPFRDDTNPSLDVWKTRANEWRWGDFAEGTQGSVIDLVKRFENVDDGAAIKKCRELMSTLDLGVEYKIENQKSFDAEKATSFVEKAVDNSNHYAILEAVYEMQKPGLAEFGSDNLKYWGLGYSNSELVIPYYDDQGNLISYKRRSGSKKYSAKGAKPAIYGAWHPITRTSILVEGESDAWAASCAKTGMAVYAIPGADTKPDKCESANVLLEAECVILAFDGDKAGRRAIGTWSSWLMTQGVIVKVAPIPDGHDIASITKQAFIAATQNLKTPAPPPEGIESTETGYVRVTKNGAMTKLSNWTAEPVKHLIGGSCPAYEVSIAPQGKTAILAEKDMASKSAMIRWGQPLSLHWYGTDVDAQKLASLLASQAVALPTGNVYSRIGMVDDGYAWPGGAAVRSGEWTYVPPVANIGVESKVMLPESCGEMHTDATTLANMLALSGTEVTHPMLAWLALSPLRPMFRQFPFLAVSGPSGSGKTTLTQAMIEYMSGTLLTTNLTSTTPYGVSSFIGASNAFPVWFDEFRPGAREDALAQLNQILRDAYTGQPSTKGGMQSDKSALTLIPTDTPIVITGEDTLIETSHTDRAVTLYLKSGKQNPDALYKLRLTPPGSMALRYLQWLSFVWLPQLGAEYIQPKSVEASEQLNDRQMMNIAVLDFGWRLLREFVEVAMPPALYLMPERPDLSQVVSESEDATRHNPVQDAVKWAWESQLPSVRAHGGAEIAVIPAILLEHVIRSRMFTLPTSNSRGLKKFLIESMGGREVRIALGVGSSSATARAVALPRSTVESV